MKTYPKQRIGIRAYIGESMVKILICDDDQTFAQSMFKRILYALISKDDFWNGNNNYQAFSIVN